MPSVAKRSWKTENWTCIGGEVFMIQQKWELCRDSKYKSSTKGKSVSVTLESFPTDEWRIISLHEVVPDKDMQKLIEAHRRKHES